MVSSRDRSSEVRPPIKSSFPFGNLLSPFLFHLDLSPYSLRARPPSLVASQSSPTSSIIHLYRVLAYFLCPSSSPILHVEVCILLAIEEIGTKFEPGNYQSSFPSLPPLTFSSVILRSRIVCTISSTFLHLLESGMTLGNQWDSAREFSTDNEGKMGKGIGWWNNVWPAANETIGFL